MRIQSPKFGAILFYKKDEEVPSAGSVFKDGIAKGTCTIRDSSAIMPFNTPPSLIEYYPKVLLTDGDVFTYGTHRQDGQGRRRRANQCADKTRQSTGKHCCLSGKGLLEALFSQYLAEAEMNF